MSVKLLTEHHLEFLSVKGGCTGSSESTLVKMRHCLKSCVADYCFLLQMEVVKSHGVEVKNINQEIKRYYCTC